MKKRAVIFDLDGTLLDTLEDLANSVNSVLSHNGYPTHEVDTFRNRVGGGARNLIASSVPEKLASEEKIIERLLGEYKAHYSRHDMDRTAPYEGIQDMLISFSRRQIPMGVCSNKHHLAVEKLVFNLFPDGLFRAVSGEREGIPRKPDPAQALLLAAEMGATPKETVFVGDSGVDMDTARAAQMYPVGVSWGFRDMSELTEHGAAWIAKKPGELIDFFFTDWSGE